MQIKDHKKNQQKKLHRKSVDDEDDYVYEEDVNDGSECKESNLNNKPKKRGKKRNNNFYETVNIINLSI